MERGAEGSRKELVKRISISGFARESTIRNLGMDEINRFNAQLIGATYITHHKDSLKVEYELVRGGFWAPSGETPEEEILACELALHYAATGDYVQVRRCIMKRAYQRLADAKEAGVADRQVGTLLLIAEMMEDHGRSFNIPRPAWQNQNIVRAYEELSGSDPV